MASGGPQTASDRLDLAALWGRRVPASRFLPLAAWQEGALPWLGNEEAALVPGDVCGSSLPLDVSIQLDVLDRLYLQLGKKI